MTISRTGTRPVQPGPSEYFTGSVRVERFAEAKPPSRVSIASVTFEAGARTNWHTHPYGQHLVITSGVGWVQVEGGSVEEVRPGDVVWFPPHTHHWHGASPDSAMTHLAVQEAAEGGPVDWKEPVSGEQYQR
ncbi:MAG: cupin domain-containing protein [Phycisphaerales bacterium]|nr:cupin domain-containing protein [Phycisphaerales bacterium]